MLSLSELGEQIATKRKALGLTLAMLAKKARVVISTLEALEKVRLGELGYSKITNILTALGLELKLRKQARKPSRRWKNSWKKDGMIKVWTGVAEAGLLVRHGERGSTFAYSAGAPPTRAVSVTMPLRLESWSVPFGLLPVFEMNLPEGALRERLRLAFAKATGTFDEFDLLSIVGRSQIGRIRYTGDKEHLHEDVPFQSVDEILERRRGGDLFRYLLEKFATYSGISGVQPTNPRARRKGFRRDGAYRTPPLTKLQGRDPHREAVGAQRISAAGGQ